MKKNVPVSKIMTANPMTVHTKQKLSEVRTLMEQNGFHHVPVVSGTKLVGMLSSTDILRASYTYEGDMRQTDNVLDHTVSIEQLMTRDMQTVGPHTTIRNATEILAEGAFHSLPVVEDGDLVGLVTTTDILRDVLARG
ncbi:MAG: CBS domain-containing protein [Deltaproteobacteria bacterium]|nr:MAG: CBS domain-containing protein [Deltaproteobacteria bacterium]